MKQPLHHSYCLFLGQSPHQNSRVNGYSRMSSWHRDGQSPSVTAGLTKEKAVPCLESGHWPQTQGSIHHTAPRAHASRPCSETTSSRRSAVLSPPLAVFLTTQMVSTSVFCPKAGEAWRLELCPVISKPPSTWNRLVSEEN